MKKFADLTPPQQEGAVQITLKRLVHAITEGGLRFNDAANGNHLQDRIDRAREEADRVQDPTLWARLVLERCKEDLTGIARRSAEDAVFTTGESVIAVEDIT